MKSTNIPEVKLGIVAVSRDCFPIQLSEKRRAAIVAACQAKGLDLYEAKTTVENEKDMEKAVAEVTEAGCNALTVFLGNFGPETPETLIAKFFNGPCMFVAAAEGDGDMINGRGFIASALVILCSWKPLRAYMAAYLFGLAQALIVYLQVKGVAISMYFTMMLPYLLTLAALAVISTSKKPSMPEKIKVVSTGME